MTGVINTAPNKKEAAEEKIHGGKEFSDTSEFWPPLFWLSSADSSAVQAHDESNDCNIGDTVRIHMSRSIFALLKSVQWHQDMATDLLSSIRCYLDFSTCISTLLYWAYFVPSLTFQSPLQRMPWLRDFGHPMGNPRYNDTIMERTITARALQPVVYLPNLIDHSWLLLWLCQVWHVS